MAAHSPDRAPAIGPALLWYAALGAPAAWGVHIGARYPLVPLACQGEMPWILHLVSASCLALALGATVAALHVRKRVQPRADTTGNRIAYMANAGIVFGCLFALIIVAEVIPAFLQDPCAAPSERQR
jgi:hypothetical protein